MKNSGTPRKRADAIGFSPELIMKAKDLTLVQKGQIFKALFDDAKGKDTDPDMDPEARAVFEECLPSCHRMVEEYRRRGWLRGDADGEE